MRTLLLTGKGGVGKSTVAAATALAAARRGVPTLLLSTDGAHSLTDVLGISGPGPTGAHDPVRVTEHLWVQQVDARRRFEASWADVQGYLLGVLSATGIDPVTADELTVLPGAEEVLALLELRDVAASGRFEAVVVDCAPTAETLRLLALPEALAAYTRRLLPGGGRLSGLVGQALAPVVTRATGLPAPSETVLDAVQQLCEDLAGVRSLLTGPGASVRLVLTPERVVLAESRRTRTALGLHGYRVDGVVANRVLSDVDGSWAATWSRAQADVLTEIEESFGDLPLFRSPYLAGEPVGLDALAAVAHHLYTDTDPLALHRGPEPFSTEVTESGATLRVQMPGARAGEVEVVRAGHDLVLTWGSERRVLALPGLLSRMSVAGGSVREGTLRIRFVHDHASQDTPTVQVTGEHVRDQLVGDGQG